MNEGITRYTSRLFSKSIRKGGDLKDDYRVKLSRLPRNSNSDVDVAEQPDCPFAEQIRKEVIPAKSSVAFQSLAVTCLQTLWTVLEQERQAEAAAISLAQGEKLQHLIHTLESTAEAVADLLDAQGSRMLTFRSEEALTADEDNSWWFALAESIQAIEDGTTRILSLAAGQPKGGAGRRLSAITARLLRSHHHKLLVEADAWIS